METVNHYGTRPDTGAPAGADFFLKVPENLPRLDLEKGDKVYFRESDDFKPGAVVAIVPTTGEGNPLFRRAYPGKVGVMLIGDGVEDCIINDPENPAYKIIGVGIAVYRRL